MKKYNAEHSERDKPKALERYYKNREARLSGCRAYYQANRERKLEYSAKRREANPDLNHDYYVRNKDRLLARGLEYNAANRESIRRHQKQYRRENAAAINERVARRNAAKRRATPAWSSKIETRKAYMMADIMSRITGKPWHVDHIVPLVSPLVCGLHCAANLTVIPGAENIRKNNRHWPYMPS